MYGPNGDSLNTKEEVISKYTEKEEKVQTTLCSCLSSLGSGNKTFGLEMEGCTDLEEGETQQICEDVSYSKHKMKKKKKFKNAVEDLGLEKHKCKLRNEYTKKEEWPILGSPSQSDNQTQKRKSSNYETQKERPLVS